MNKKDEIKKKHAEGSVCNLACNVMDAIEDVFGSATPKPNGLDMIDALALASVFLLGRQIKCNCNGKKTMQSVMKGTIWSLKNQIDTLAAPFIEEEEPWDMQIGECEEGGENEQS